MRMITCPSCESSSDVEIEASRDVPGQWSARCGPCDHGWTFSDDL